jgi:hypothetical protein
VSAFPLTTTEASILSILKNTLCCATDFHLRLPIVVAYQHDVVQPDASGSEVEDGKWCG